MFKSIKNTWTEFYSFLINPIDKEASIQNLEIKFKQLFSILAINIPIMIVLLVIIYGVEQTGLIDVSNHKVVDILQRLPFWTVVLFGVFIIPFVEEIVFRLHLRLQYNYPVKILIFLSCIAGKNKKEEFRKFIAGKWNTYYRGIIYVSALVFALIHISNYEYSIMLLVLSPIIVMPQFVIGLFAGYLRVKYGFIWGFYLHSLHNLIFLGIPLILLPTSIDKINISNEQYKLKIEEVRSGRLNSTLFLDSDSAFFNNIKLRPLIAKLLDTDENSIELRYLMNPKQRLNIVFKSYSADLNTKQIIFEKIKDLYGFKVDKSVIHATIKVLDISDTTLLFNHENKSLIDAVTVISEEHIILKNYNLNQLVKIINSRYSKYFVSNNNLKRRFDFQFSRHSFDNILIKLKNEYGLIFKQKERNIEYIIIDFRKEDSKTPNTR